MSKSTSASTPVIEFNNATQLGWYQQRMLEIIQAQKLKHWNSAEVDAAPNLKFHHILQTLQEACIVCKDHPQIAEFFKVTVNSTRDWLGEKLGGYMNKPLTDAAHYIIRETEGVQPLKNMIHTMCINISLAGKYSTDWTFQTSLNTEELEREWAQIAAYRLEERFKGLAGTIRMEKEALQREIYARIAFDEFQAAGQHLPQEEEPLRQKIIAEYRTFEAEVNPAVKLSDLVKTPVKSPGVKLSDLLKGQVTSAEIFSPETHLKWYEKRISGMTEEEKLSEYHGIAHYLYHACVEGENYPQIGQFLIEQGQGLQYDIPGLRDNLEHISKRKNPVLKDAANKLILENIRQRVSEPEHPSKNKSWEIRDEKQRKYYVGEKSFKDACHVYKNTEDAGIKRTAVQRIIASADVMLKHIPGNFIVNVRKEGFQCLQAARAVIPADDEALIQEWKQVYESHFKFQDLSNDEYGQQYKDAALGVLSL